MLKTRNNITDVNEFGLEALQSQINNGSEGNAEEQRRLRNVQEAAIKLGFKLATAALKEDYDEVEEWVDKQGQKLQ